MSRLRSGVQRLGHQAWFSALVRRFVWLDRAIQRRTRGRWSPISPAGIPTLLLRTTGRRSGQPRSQPLLYVEDGGDYVVIGSNFGQQHHPAWSGNLLAEPAAAVLVGGTEIQVHAGLTEGADREHLLAKLRGVWPAYRTYERRAEGRTIRVFRLSPMRATPATDGTAATGDDPR